MSAVKVHLYDDATLKSSPIVSGGTWSVSALSLTTGEHILKSKAEDTAGNLSGFSAVRRIKTGSLLVPTCDLINDSGESSTDNITNDNTPVIHVVLDLSSDTPTGASDVAGASVSEVKIYEKTGSSTYNLLANEIPAVNGGGIFDYPHQISVALSEGVHEYCASWVDAQGNESAKGSLLSITIDTVAPSVPAISNIADGQVFVGSSINVNGTAS